jgi:uncharacterized membrane protein YozB (DUF420 family)
VTVRDLPTLNAVLNSTATVLLLRGWWLIRHGRRDSHRNAMLAAFAASILFLTSYLIYHAQVGSVPYTGPARPLYLGILLTHVVLAAVVPILALITLYRAWKGRFAHHQKIARITLPLWLYVSVTGVIVYLMLYRFAA